MSRPLLALALLGIFSLPVCANDNGQWASAFKQGQAAAQQGHFAQSEQLYAQAMSEAQMFGKESSYVGVTLTGLAALREYEGKYAESERLFKQAEAIQEKTLPADSMHFSALWNNLASLYSRQGKVMEAIFYLQKSLAIVEKKLGPNAPETLMVRQNLAELKTHVPAGDPLPELKSTLAMREKDWGPNDKDVAQSLNNLGNYYLTHERYDDAEPLYKRALSIYEAKAGALDQYTLQVTENLATLYLLTRQYKLCESYVTRTLEDRQKTLGKDHPDVARTLEIYAKLMRATNRTIEAKALEERANEINSKVQ